MSFKSVAASIGKFVTNVATNQVIGVPVFLSRLSVFGFGMKPTKMGVDPFWFPEDGDPNMRDGYTYNPDDGKWYASPPEPAYGQFGWLNPADPEKNYWLNWYRNMVLDGRNARMRRLEILQISPETNSSYLGAKNMPHHAVIP